MVNVDPVMVGAFSTGAVNAKVHDNDGEYGVDCPLLPLAFIAETAK
jgi:hypothetical protein